MRNKHIIWTRWMLFLETCHLTLYTKYRCNKTSLNQYWNLILISSTKPCHNNDFNILHTNTSVVIGSLKVWNCFKDVLKCVFKHLFFKLFLGEHAPRPLAGWLVKATTPHVSRILTNKRWKSYICYNVVYNFCSPDKFYYIVIYYFIIIILLYCSMAKSWTIYVMYGRQKRRRRAQTLLT